MTVFLAAAADAAAACWMLDHRAGLLRWLRSMCAFQSLTLKGCEALER